jgi:hypothetical protein
MFARGVDLATVHRKIELRSGIARDKLRIFESKDPGKEPPVDVNIVADGLRAHTNSRARPQFIQVVQAELGQRAEHVLRRAVGGAEINDLIDVVFDAGGAEYGVGDQPGADVAEGETVGLGVAINIIAGFAFGLLRKDPVFRTIVFSRGARVRNLDQLSSGRV